DQRMTRELFQHMIKEADAGRNVELPRTVEVDRNGDFRLLGRPADLGAAHGAGHSRYPRSRSDRLLSACRSYFQLTRPRKPDRSDRAARRLQSRSTCIHRSALETT